jgi:phospholipid-binding lipoprotein MlaA
LIAKTVLSRVQNQLIAKASDSSARRTSVLAGLAVAATLLTAPAPALAQADTLNTVSPAIVQPAEPYDPWRRVNRPMFGFSMEVDRGVVAPIAHGYRRVVPAPVRNRVRSALDNLGEPGTALNDLAQGHPSRAGVATARFAINSTIGLLGMFDVAARMKLPYHESDFGQTLGRYGAQPGPYLYVPVVGPSNIRDGLGRIVDAITDPVSLLTGGVTTTLGATRFAATTVDARVGADSAFRALNDATDPYATTRSAYSQRRAAVVRAATGEVQALPDFEPAPAVASAPVSPAAERSATAAAAILPDVAEPTAASSAPSPAPH